METLAEVFRGPAGLVAGQGVIVYVVMVLVAQVFNALLETLDHESTGNQ